MTDRTRTTLYWVATALAIVAFAAGGAMDLAGGAKIEDQLAHLGYPAHLALVLGVWKLLGAAAIAVPGLPRLKEWAYAGMVFDLTGAAVAHADAGDAVGKIVTPLVLLAIVAASWALRPASRRLGTLRATGSTAVA